MSRTVAASRVSPRQARREREQAARRYDVVAGATSVFAEKGFHEAQMTEIAAAAELSLASLYALFDGKEAIYQEVMRRATENVHEVVRARVERVDDPRQRILVFIDALLECFEANRALLRILLSGTHGLPWHVREKMGDASKEVLDGFYQWINGLCSDAIARLDLDEVTPEALTAAIVGTATNLAAWNLERQPQNSLKDAAPAVRALIRRVIDGGGK